MNSALIVKKYVGWRIRCHYLNKCCIFVNGNQYTKVFILKYEFERVLLSIFLHNSHDIDFAGMWELTVSFLSLYFIYSIYGNIGKYDMNWNKFYFISVTVNKQHIYLLSERYEMVKRYIEWNTFSLENTHTHTSNKIKHEWNKTWVEKWIRNVTITYVERNMSHKSYHFHKA